MRVLVVGGSGYLGAAIADAAAAAGHTVTATSRRPRQSVETVAGGRLRTTTVSADAHEGRAHSLRWAVADPSQPDSLRPAVRNSDVIINAAVGDVRTDAALAATVRTEEHRDGQVRHLVHLSGCSAYGRHRHLVLDENTDLDAGAARSQSEAVITSDAGARTVLRPGMVFGGDARSSIVGRWFRAAQDGHLTHLGATGKRWSWVHVDDVAAAAVALLRRTVPTKPQSYLLAAGDAVAPLQVLQAVAGLVDPALRVEHAPIEHEDPLYRVFDRDEVIDARAARDQLKWMPRPTTVIADLPTSYERWRLLGDQRAPTSQ